MHDLCFALALEILLQLSHVHCALHTLHLKARLDSGLPLHPLSKSWRCLTMDKVLGIDFRLRDYDVGVGVAS